MEDYTAKTYVANGKEEYIFGIPGYGGSFAIHESQAFTLGLLRMLYLDMDPVRAIAEKTEQACRNLVRTKDEFYADEVQRYLDQLAESHVYFWVTKLDWSRRLKLARQNNYAFKYGRLVRDYLPQGKFNEMPDRIAKLQRLGLALIEDVMDIDRTGDRFQERLRDYYLRTRNDSQNVFRFHPCRINYELVDSTQFIEVLYPETVYDFIDFHLRLCLQQEMRARRCKNCGRWFIITTKSTAEYCDVTLDERGHTCKQRGAIKRWVRSKSVDPVFLEYRREYKRRFAWIRAGAISDTAFYAWSAAARKMKAACEAGEISFEEFRAWLARP